MAKGDDAVRRKKNKISRKRMRSSESSVSARIASIIASKRRRKAGKRRICEGMCFSLPTPDDPFNDGPDNKPIPKKKPKKPPPRKPKEIRPKAPPCGPADAENKMPQIETAAANRGDKLASAVKDGEQAIGRPKVPLKLGDDGSSEEGCLSKFLILCLNAIQAAWEEEDGGAIDGCADRPLLASTWGVQFWTCSSAGSNVVDTSGTSASREQVAWLVSMASDTIARKEKLGLTVASPFLLYLVPSQEKAVQVRSVCRPLKALGVHTVSLHPGASLDHQIRGLKSCEPEFLVSTPERLLELVSVRAIDISGTSLLVLDGLNDFVDSGFVDKVKSIRENICGDPQIVVFNDCFGEVYTPLVQNLIRGPVHRLSLHDSIVSQSAFISQYVHFYTSEEEKLSKALQILTEACDNQTPSRHLKILFIALTASRAQTLASNLKAEGFAISYDSLSNGLHGAIGDKATTTVSVKDIETVQSADVEEFEIVIFVEFPSSIEDYVGILTKIARYSVVGVLHSFFCKADARLALSLIQILEQCGQTVPKTLENFELP